MTKVMILNLIFSALLYGGWEKEYHAFLVENEPREKTEIYKQLADRGEPMTQFAIGHGYEEGQEGWFKINIKKAIFWYEKSAEQGFADAQWRLGMIYAEHEKNGIDSDPEKVLYWWRKSAEQGNSSRQFTLAHALLGGWFGLKNPKEGVYWMKKAAELGLPDAQYKLGVSYLVNDVFQRDLSKAEYWIRKAFEGKNEQAKETYNKFELWKYKEDRIEKEILAETEKEAQIAQLEQKTGGADDLETYLKKAPAAKADPAKWLFIVAIENYEFTDPVVYSANSAKRFKEVAQKRLGVLEKNTRFLLNEGATAAKVRHHLQEMLSRVKEGDTVYVYYSGHGVPVAKQENAPYMLAQDMSPEYVAEDERFKLQNIYKSLSDSKAGKVVAFVDSCFSGGADNTALFKGVAATRLKPKAVTFDTQKMVVITAGSGLEYSNKYDEKSNRLFSYYVMRGLINNNENMQRLYDYVKSNVQEKSYEMGVSYEQVPVFEGNIGLGL